MKRCPPRALKSSSPKINVYWNNIKLFFYHPSKTIFLFLLHRVDILVHGLQWSLWNMCEHGMISKVSVNFINESIFNSMITQSECNGVNGLASGKCAIGFGICCVLSSSSCGETISRNLTYIRYN